MKEVNWFELLLVVEDDATDVVLRAKRACVEDFRNKRSFPRYYLL